MDIEPQKPEKVQAPLLIIGFLFLVTSGVSLLPASWFGVKQETRRYAPLVLSEGATGTDTDNDGTVSWKEYMEQSLSIDGSSLGTTTETDPRMMAALNDPSNLTSSFTKNLYVASIALKENGVTDSNTEQQVMTELMKKEAEKITPTVFTKGDIKISNTTSKDALKAYGNSVASILNGLITEKSISSDLTAVTTFVQSENEADLIPVINNRKKIDAALQKLLALQVPTSAQEVHLVVLNSIGTFSGTLQNLTQAYDDPVRATYALKSYTDDAITALRSIPTLANFFSSQNVVFSAKESGYLFTAGYTNQ